MKSVDWKNLGFCVLALGSLLVAAQPSFAGGESSGGGNAIACMNPATGKSVELLDYYEAQLTTTLTIDLGPDTGSYMDRINYVLNRLERLDPIAAETFRARAKTFESETRFITPAEMKAIADSNEEVNPPSGCVKEQFAIQNFDIKPDEARYLVNQTLWNEADTETKAGLVLHEVIYTDAHDQFQQTNSDGTRYYNAEISSSKMQTMGIDEYVAVLEAAKFPGWERQSGGICDQLSQPTGASTLLPKGAVFYPCTALIDTSGVAGTVESGSLFLAGGSLDLSHAQIGCGTVKPDPVTGAASGGEVCQVSLPQDAGKQFAMEVGGIHAVATDSFSVYANGIPSNAIVRGDQSITVGALSVDLHDGDEMSFYPSGKVGSVIPAHDIPVQVENQTEQLLAGKYAEFSQDGKLIQGYFEPIKSLSIGGNTFVPDPTQPISLYPDGNPSSISLTGDTSVVIAGQQLMLSSKTDLARADYAGAGTASVRFYDNGAISQAVLASDGFGVVAGRKVLLFHGDINLDPLGFYEDGSLQSGTVENSTEVHIPNGKGSVTLRPTSGDTFYPDGSLESGSITTGAHLFGGVTLDVAPGDAKSIQHGNLHDDNTKVDFGGGQVCNIEFDKSGDLTSGDCGLL